VKARMLCLLLLSACGEYSFDDEYALTWTCLSPGGCQRAEEVALVNRLTIFRDSFEFTSTRDTSFYELAQRVASSSVPDGCALLYNLSLFGHELEPSLLCSTSRGFDLELSIPNRTPATASQWRVEIREL
jgi:hypothetical protein